MFTSSIWSKAVSRAELDLASRRCGAARHGDRLMIVVNPRRESLSVLALLDAGAPAGR